MNQEHGFFFALFSCATLFSIPNPLPPFLTLMLSLLRRRLCPVTPVLPCPVLFCPVLSCPILSCAFPCPLHDDRSPMCDHSPFDSPRKLSPERDLSLVDVQAHPAARVRPTFERSATERFREAMEEGQFEVSNRFGE